MKSFAWRWFILLAVFAAGCGTVPQFELSEGDRIIAERPANLWRGWEAVGGKMIITTREVRFQPHAFNVHKSPADIPIGEIATLTVFDSDFGWGTVANGLKIVTSQGTPYVFAVSDRDYVMGLLEGEMQKVAEGSVPAK